MAESGHTRDRLRAETAELRALRLRIDQLDRQIVGLLNERTRLGLDVGRAKIAAGRRTVRDDEREREVLVRVAMANDGPLPQEDLLAVYRRLVRATRELQRREHGGPGPNGGQP